jgi:hypothetical protein
MRRSAVREQGALFVSNADGLTHHSLDRVIINAQIAVKSPPVLSLVLLLTAVQKMTLYDRLTMELCERMLVAAAAVRPERGNGR